MVFGEKEIDVHNQKPEERVNHKTIREQGKKEDTSRFAP